MGWPFPTAEFDKVLHRKFEVLEKDFDFSTMISKAVIYVAKDYKEWQKAILTFCQSVPLNDEQTGPADPKGWAGELRNSEAFKSLSKDDAKKAVPFASFMMRDEMSVRGPSALDLQLPFDELEMLKARAEVI